MRFHPVDGGQGHAQASIAAQSCSPDCFIAAFVSIPILNLATPLFAMAFMVHMHKKLSAAAPS